MKVNYYFFLIFFAFTISCQTDNTEKNLNDEKFVAPLDNDRMRLFDEGWTFSKTENENAIAYDFDDSSWRTIDLPHDWSIEDLPEGEGLIGPFSKESPGGISTGFTIGGTGFYRKSFKVLEEDKDKKFSIYFDGVYMESDVWINGHHLGFHPNGYTPFYYELTDYLDAPGKDNVLVVRAKNLSVNSRWYSGSGIYRHVWLRVTNPVNVPVWGIFVTTPSVSEENAIVNCSVSIRNQLDIYSEVVVRNSILDLAGNAIVSKDEAIKIPGNEEESVIQSIEVKKPKLWSLESPNLYMLKTEIYHKGSVVDVVETNFGIRSMHFSSEKGFLLNGKSVILKGGNLHHDNGILGSATYDRAEQRRVEIMKFNGFNAIRTSHNPPSKQFLDACDRLGILVMDEAFDQWEVPKKPNDYHRFFGEWSKQDIQSMILRDRNHPAIFAWSYGNEVYERADSSGIRIAWLLIAAIKELDKTRPVTQAICDFWNHPGDRPWSDTYPAFELMDIKSYNYQIHYEDDHKKYPDWVMLGSETFADEAYGNYHMAVEKPYVIGDFVWTGMDYLGEAGIGQAALDSVQMKFPWFNGFCGDINLVGFKKPQSYYRDVLWGRSPLEVAIEQPTPEGRKWVFSLWGWRNELQSWNWKEYENQPMDVYVYSQAEKVAVFLNDDQIAEQFSTDSAKYIYHFKIPYRPGVLKAIAFNEDQKIAEKRIKTTGPASQIILKPDRESIYSNRNDLAYIEVNLLDENGNLVLDDDQVVSFEIKGVADLIGVGNGNPVEMKSFQADSCKTFNGKAMAVVRPRGDEGNITVTAYAKKLKAKTETINCVR